jgi:hypothetical protein
MTTKSVLFGARRGFLLIPVAILSAWFALSPAARAVSPAPDGGYPGENTAEGTDALFTNKGGDANTAIGFNALFSNTTGSVNTATGVNALQGNRTGAGNTASGANALLQNTTGSFNTANGVGALSGNTTGTSNTACGFRALSSNTTGSFNTATGTVALADNTTGSGNTASGVNALFNNTGSGNIALGISAGRNLTTGNNNIDIGNQGVAGESNTIRIGWGGVQKAAFIDGIRGAVVPGGIGVVIGADGHLGTFTSSARFKEAIKPMGKASEVILALKPVTFRYNHKLDPEGIPQVGLVAEEVAKVNPDLVARDDKGKVNTVRYEAVNAMLLNEVLKEHRKVQELEAAVAQLQKEIKHPTASLKEQTMQIKKARAASLK